MVIDPSTADSIVNIRAWAVNIIQPFKGGKGFLVIKDAKYYTYPDDENGKFEDEKNLWEDAQNKELLDAGYTKSVETILKARFGILEVNKIKNFENRIREMLK